MNEASTPAGIALADLAPTELSRDLAGPGLWLDIGAATIRVRSNVPALATQLRTVYGAYPRVSRADWADVHVRIERVLGVRRWFKPQATLHTDGLTPFQPFPADSALPLFEWGCNWLLGRCLNDMLLLHAGVVERDGLALLLPATPGSGKSTLTAALMQRGWRLLSDEFGAYDLEAGVFRALLKPIALKNQSIDVMQRFAPDAVFGPSFPNTRKGTVTHLAPGPADVARRHLPVRPGAVVLPKWRAGSPARWERLDEHMLFSSLAFNAFNYGLLGAAGFRAVVRLVRQCPGWQLVYGDLDDAVALIDAAWPEVADRHATLS